MNRKELLNKLRRIIASRKFQALAGFLLLIKLLDVAFPLPDSPTYSKVITARDGTMLSAYLTPDDKWRLYTSVDEVNPDLIKAVIEKEDNWFYRHPGVNPMAVLRAAYQNIIRGKRVSGASTITMQLARILEPAERTYLNKFLEILRAVQLELHYSKVEILELYLSNIPMGGNIEGVKAASYIYFNRPPAKLSLAQSVVFAIIPNDPNKLRLDKSTDSAIIKRNRWLDRFKNNGIFEPGIISSAIDEQLTPARFAMPNLAPHFCYEVSNLYSDDLLATSIDLNLQRTTERILLNYISGIKSRGITNGAVIVIDNEKHQIVAYCGSADFYDNTSSGQVNGVASIRSPGSALKPFLYAAALDAGMYTPKMRLLDVPTDFSGYMPENYDEKFNGSVTFEYALVHSLNVPAVRLLNEFGYVNFINLLSSGGFTEIDRQKSNLGLSLVLGGCGVTLVELTTFYSVFADSGNFVKPGYLLNENYDEAVNKVYSSDAAFIISKILSDNERPDFPNILSDATRLPRISWKTGTSYGKRDAWAIGFNKNYTIGIWTGNFNGKGSPYLSGKEIAVPLLFNIFNTIDYNPDSDLPSQPETTHIRKVCTETGMIPSEHCATLTEDYYIENISSNKMCDLQQEVFVSTDGENVYCRECLPLNGYRKEFHKFYQPELLAYYKHNNINYDKLPKHFTGCSTIRQDQKPVILSPSSDTEYLVEKNSGQKIMLQASSPLNVSSHFWYVNDRYLGKTGNSGKLFYIPVEGKNKIVCINNLGAEANLKISVKYY